MYQDLNICLDHYKIPGALGRSTRTSFNDSPAVAVHLPVLQMPRQDRSWHLLQRDQMQIPQVFETRRTFRVRLPGADQISDAWHSLAVSAVLRQEGTFAGLSSTVNVSVK